jgi:hypothetical protein
MRIAAWTLFLLVTSLLILLGILPRPLLTNIANLQAATVYAAHDTPVADRFVMLRNAWSNACRALPVATCFDSSHLADTAILNAFDKNYLHPLKALMVLTDTNQILSLADLRLGGDSRANQQASVTGADHVTLWGNGYLEARLFVLNQSAWTISVKAQHDNPPPVILTLTLDGQPAGNLMFDKGDLSWGYLSTDPISLSPGFHWLHIWYANDYFDQKSGQDRNATIRLVEFTR